MMLVGAQVLAREREDESDSPLQTSSQGWGCQRSSSGLVACTEKLQIQIHVQIQIQIHVRRRKNAAASSLLPSLPPLPLLQEGFNSFSAHFTSQMHFRVQNGRVPLPRFAKEAKEELCTLNISMGVHSATPLTALWPVPTCEIFNPRKKPPHEYPPRKTHQRMAQKHASILAANTITTIFLENQSQ